MIRHTALFTFNDTVSTVQIGELMSAMLTLKDEIPAVEHIVWGENFSPRAGGHTHVISVEFSDRAALAVFYDHPAHQRIAQTLIKPITAELLIVDYEEKSTQGDSAEDAARSDRS